MNKQEVHKRAINKAETQISFIQLEIKALEKEIPYMSFTQEMIAGQIEFKRKELESWKMILKSLKWLKKTRYNQFKNKETNQLSGVELLQSLADLNAQ